MTGKTRLTRRVAMAAATTLITLGTFAGNALAETTLERIMSSKKVTIGIHNRSPWGFRGDDGEATGFHPDIIRAAFKQVGITDIEFIVSDFGALIPGLLAGRIDLVASGLAITPARCEQVLFSDPDLKIGDGVLVEKGNPHNIHSYKDIADNPDLTIGGSRGSSNVANALAAGIPDAQVRQFQNSESSIAAMEAGRVDAATFSSATAISILKDPKVTGLERAMPFKGYIKPNGQPAANYAAIAFRKTDPDLRDRYNELLKNLKADGTVTSMMEKYGFTAEETAPDNIETAKLCSGEQ